MSVTSKKDETCRERAPNNLKILRIFWNVTLAIPNLHEFCSQFTPQKTGECTFSSFRYPTRHASLPEKFEKLKNWKKKI